MFEILYFCDNEKCKKPLKAPYLQITSDGRAGLVKTTGTKAVTEDVDPLDMFLIFCDTDCMKAYIDDRFWPLKSTEERKEKGQCAAPECKSKSRGDNYLFCSEHQESQLEKTCPFCNANPCKKRFKACKA